MTTSSFSSLQAQLSSTAEYAQSDAASELYDFWFGLATEFAQGRTPVLEMQRYTRQALEIMLTSYTLQRIRDPSTDLYAVRELMRHTQAIFEILRTKPKFTPLLDPTLHGDDDGVNVNALSQWLRHTGLRALEAIAFTETMHSGVRVDALTTIQSMLELWEFLNEGPWAVAYATTYRLDFQLAHLAQTISSVSTDSIVRDAALLAMQHIARIDKGYAPVIALSRIARDVLALTPLWSMGVLASSVAMDNLVVKMLATSVDHAATKALFCTALMESLYEAIMNNRSSREWAFDAQTYETNLVHLFSVCLQTYHMHDADVEQEHEHEHEPRHPNEGNRVVLPDAYLHAMESMLQTYPDCTRIVRFALDANEYGMFVMVSRMSHAFHENVWTDFILPFARAELALLPLQGVSGSQRDQEIINLIREACRLYYINIDRVPTSLLGQNVFLTVIQAIRHGYYETERFTEILALILHRHYSMGHVQVYQWIPTLLLQDVAHNHKTSRALGESLLIALGLQHSSFGLENAIMSAETSKAISEAFSVILAKLRSGPADMFWIEVCLNFGQFIQEHRAAMSALLHSIQVELELADARGTIAVDRLESLTELLHAISMRIDSIDAYTVFRLSLQVIQLGAGAATATMFEDTLVNALDCMSEKDSCDLITAEVALSVCGPRTRAALSQCVPHLCLEDIDPTVRQAALRNILPYPETIRTHSITVIRSLYWIHYPMYKAVDESSKLRVDQLALATEACPVLVVLAGVAPLYVKECISKLLSAADIHALNDPLNESKFIEPHLNALARAVSRNILIRFALSPGGLPLLPLLVYLSPVWQQLIHETVQSGLLVEETSRFTLVAGEFRNLERMVREPRAFRCTDQGRSTLVELMGAESADTAQTVPSRNQLHQLIMNEQEKGAYMKALRLANTMRAWYPDDYVQMGTQEVVVKTLLPKVYEFNFPHSNRGYPSNVLDAFPSYYRVMHEVKLLFPVESEDVLQLSKQIDAFCLAKLHMVLSLYGPDEAKQWMALYNFHTPMATALVNDVPLKLPAVAAIAVPVQPSAPTWAETMLCVLDGELPAVTLDTIALDNV
ncbi:Aste57867_14938 [Aphanomyces stellatus]|uniref:Aste57867_14938 protein n=1 Tax=Aphanomyces stellatus TaxID=120398 RepID=A0A485L2V0_9STRA|nr:hypothetical protein As57867_014882 [Aphanomyces stellatus]VFT91752.1 Aste57867_14938 [Aphanomyces stellatus]